MKTSKLTLVSVGIALLLLISAPASADDSDPWYEDANGHWSEQYLAVLWEEGVTDGYVGERRIWTGRRWRTESYSLFNPDDPVGRAQYAMMLAKVFRLQPIEDGRLSFADVPADYSEYNGKRAAGYVEAVHRSQLLSLGEGNLFHPTDFITREDAVESLIQSLQLTRFADAMSSSEISQILSGFQDSGDIRGERRPEVALAVKLKIIEGYPDRTLRMRRDMKRSEAATILYRSCLVRADASPNPFSPDGDGIEDVTSFTVIPLKNRSVKRWELLITNFHGDVLRRMGPLSGTGEMREPVMRVWEGRNNADIRLPKGTYYYRARVWDSHSQEFDSVTKPIILEDKRLTGSIRPSKVEPGDLITIEAHTTGRAERVEAATLGTTVSLVRLGSASDAANWESECKVPATAQLGTHNAILTAFYPDGATRQIELEYEVTSEFELSAEVFPNPAYPGQAVNITAHTSKPVDRVHAVLPWNATIGLTSADREYWASTTRVPKEMAEGEYDIRVEAWRNRSVRVVNLRLHVLEDPTRKLKFVLTD